MPLPGHLTLEGEKQGKIAGSCAQAGREGTILCQSLNHEVRIPRDPQTGLAKGKRVHEAFSITKEIDASTPALNKALTTGEHLKKVQLKLYRINKNGAEEQYYTVTLEDAILVSVRPFFPNALDPSLEYMGHMEEISFTYRKIIWRAEIDGKESDDDWLAPAAG